MIQCTRVLECSVSCVPEIVPRSESNELVPPWTCALQNTCWSKPVSCCILVTTTWATGAKLARWSFDVLNVWADVLAQKRPLKKKVPRYRVSYRVRTNNFTAICQNQIHIWTAAAVVGYGVQATRCMHVDDILVAGIVR